MLNKGCVVVFFFSSNNRELGFHPQTLSSLRCAQLQADVVVNLLPLGTTGAGCTVGRTQSYV